MLKTLQKHIKTCKNLVKTKQTESRRTRSMQGPERSDPAAGQKGSTQTRSKVPLKGLERDYIVPKKGI